MRCGCISLGNVQCDECNRIIDYLEHYLVTDEVGDPGKHLCLDCAGKRGYVHYRQEKGVRSVTFFEEEPPASGD
jgi:hypothetical protein